LTLQAVVDFEIETDGRSFEVKNGDIIHLSQHKLEKLLAKVPDHVRVIHPGLLVEWDSPILGRCSGLVTGLTADLITIGKHGVTKKSVTIPATWLTRVTVAERGTVV